MIRTAMAASVTVLALAVVCAAPRAEEAPAPQAAPPRAEEAAPPARSDEAAPMPRGGVAPAPVERGPDGENGRFTLNRVSDSFLRLDTRTGQVSLCGQRSGGWTCQTVPDDRAALEQEIARLQGETAALKKELAARAGPPAAAEPPVSRIQPRVPSTRPELHLPSDAELDQMMVFMEKLWRRLIDMVQNVQKNIDRKG